MDGSWVRLRSAQAVRHFREELDLSRARALAAHPRIGQAARKSGFLQVFQSRPTLPEVIAANEAIAALGRPDGHRPRVRAIALNTALLEPQAAAQVDPRRADPTGPPFLDPVAAGAAWLLAAPSGPPGGGCVVAE